jgi:hypothetical protein
MTDLNNKPCRKCGSTDRYKPSPGRKTGDCKACQKAKNKAWQQANPEKNRAFNKAWRKANPEKNWARTKAWQQANPEKTQARINAYQKNNPKKRAAHNAVNNAIKRGDLPRVSTCDCVDCGIQATEYHHEDYNKPLKVVALCKKCHVKQHYPSTNELTNHSHQTRQAQYV